MLCNVTGNYQRRRVHTLPCHPAPNPGPPAPPPPIKPVIAAGSVTATNCNTTSPLQRWTLVPAPALALGVNVVDDDVGEAERAQSSSSSSFSSGTTSKQYVVRSAGGRGLCLGYDSNTSAYGGHGNSVVARPCGDGTPTAWSWEEVAGGSYLSLQTIVGVGGGAPSNLAACGRFGHDSRKPDQPAGHFSTSANTGASANTSANSSECCVHPVACTACHGTDVYTPPRYCNTIPCVHRTQTSLLANWLPTNLIFQLCKVSAS
jgi:hypothetical protein